MKTKEIRIVWKDRVTPARHGFVREGIYLSECLTDKPRNLPGKHGYKVVAYAVCEPVPDKVIASCFRRFWYLKPNDLLEPQGIGLDVALPYEAVAPASIAPNVESKRMRGFKPHLQGMALVMVEEVLGSTRSMEAAALSAG